MRTSACVALAAIAALVGPPGASAHIRSGVVAVDYRADVFSLSAPVREAVGVRVYESDRALGSPCAPATRSPFSDISVSRFFASA